MRLGTPGTLSETVAEAISEFGAAVLAKRSLGIGQPEDQMRAPLEQLLRRIAKAQHMKLVAHGEVPIAELKVRADYAISIGGAICGYVEVKAPGKGVVPDEWSVKSHNRRQWEKLRKLPNLLYTDGNDWALYRDGEPLGEPARVDGDIRKSGKKLALPDGELLRVLTDFLTWVPERPNSLRHLVKNVAGLCSLLREEVEDALRRERAGDRETRFSSLVEDWRHLLFPDLTDDQFADGYAQTVTFALLLARAERISFEGRSIEEIALLLRKSHPLMGKALTVLTESSALGKLKVTVDMLSRVIGVVDWEWLDNGSGDVYRRLYDQFLEEYDPELRKQTGVYYTPDGVVSFMVRFVDQVLRTKHDKRRGFGSYELVVVDPAMGTGTFLVDIVDQVAEAGLEDEGDVAGSNVRQLAGRLIGFEKQAGPFAVAGLRLHEVIHHHGTDPPAGGMRLYLADTLDDPRDEERRLAGIDQPTVGSGGFFYRDIKSSRQEANKVKTTERVYVVIGNPPYRDKAKGFGGWIEKGSPHASPIERPPLDAFRGRGLGKLEYVLSNLYVYFWRWATWKVFDAHSEAPAGIVAFITPSGYLVGRGYAGMREYLRRTADEGWIIDVSPEGHRPPIPTRVFRGVQQPLCIGIFTRYGSPTPETPATIHHLSISGSQEQKFARLGTLRLEDLGWETCPTEWQAPLKPRVSIEWNSFPTVPDLFPWSTPGVKPNRSWVYAPDPQTLRDRWDRLIRESPELKGLAFKETHDRTIDTRLPQSQGLNHSAKTLREETMLCPEPIRVGYRSFDRQWLIPDSRVIDRPRPQIWRSHGDRQVYLTEPRTDPVTAGPALTFSAHPPDMHHYHGRGGAVVPLYHDQAGRTANVASGLLHVLSTALGLPITASHLLAYVAAVTSHRGFSSRFSQELTMPGVRIPLTADPNLFQEAISIGEHVIWLHTYGERFIDSARGRPAGPPQLPQGHGPRVASAIPHPEVGRPHSIKYDPDTETLHIDAGKIRPVPSAVWNYQVSGMNVVRKWFGYRRKDPAHRRTSPLAYMNGPWTAPTTTELLDLLRVLQLLIELEPAQGSLLDRICAAPLITVEDLRAAGVQSVASGPQTATEANRAGQQEIF